MNPDKEFEQIFSFPPVQGSKEEEEYEKFVQSMVAHCHCCSSNKPCDGVLAGGICDNIQEDERDGFDWDEDEEFNNDPT